MQNPNSFSHSCGLSRSIHYAQRQARSANCVPKRKIHSKIEPQNYPEENTHSFSCILEFLDKSNWYTTMITCLEVLKRTEYSVISSKGQTTKKNESTNIGNVTLTLVHVKCCIKVCSVLWRVQPLVPCLDFPQVAYTALKSQVQNQSIKIPNIMY